MAFIQVPQNPGLQVLNQIRQGRLQQAQQDNLEADEEIRRQQIAGRAALANQFGQGALDPNALAQITQSQAQQGFADANQRRVDLAEQGADAQRRAGAVANFVAAGRQVLDRTGDSAQVAALARRFGPALGATEDDIIAFEQALGQDPAGALDSLGALFAQQAQSPPSVTGQPIQVIGPDGEPALAQQFEDGSTRFILDNNGNLIRPARFERGLAGEGEQIFVDQQGNIVGRQIPGTSAEAETERTRVQTQQGRQEIEGVERERRQEAGQARRRAEAGEQRLELVEGLIDRADEQATAFTAGLGSLTSVIPGTPAANLAATLDTIRANVGFDELQRLRDNSPTGGALGQVSERENLLLQSVLGSIDQSQTASQLRSNLQALREQLRLSARRVRRAFEEDFGVAPQQGEGGIFDLREPQQTRQNSQPQPDTIIERDPETGQLVIREGDS